MMLRAFAAYKLRLLAVLPLVLLTAGTDLRAQETTLELDPAGSRIEFTLVDVLHTVHGSFVLKSGTLHFNPVTGQASGSVAVDVRSGQSGNPTRDRKMHTEILESDRYPEASFTPTRMSGAWTRQGSSTIQLEGTFRIHGQDHSVRWTVAARSSPNHLSFKVHTVVPYVDWGMKNPSTFILRVSDKVDLDIAAVGRFTEVIPGQAATGH
jgi:polyisoprenoid-binding protein YceI